MSALRVALVPALMLVLLVPPPGDAQPTGKVHRIGLLGANTLEQYGSQIDALRSGLRDLGHVEGKNLVIEFRWAEGRYMTSGASATDDDTNPRRRSARHGGLSMAWSSRAEIRGVRTHPAVRLLAPCPPPSGPPSARSARSVGGGGRAGTATLDCQ